MSPPVLPDIPLIDAPDGPLQLARQRTAQLRRIVALTRELIPTVLLRWGDQYAVRCLRASGNPYLAEIEAVARLLGQPGAHALNFSFEMGCTTACHQHDGGSAMGLYRTLDWPFRLGGEVVVARHAPPAGPYYNITWPGYVGVLTGLAPGRFAAAINQPPMSFSLERISFGLPVDWVVNRWRIRVTPDLPPTHLLRQAFERCASYAEAKALLTSTPVCLPVIYTLTGTKAGEGCIIERRERDAVVHDGPACITNHWLNRSYTGHPRRGRNSRRRLAAMTASLPSLGQARFGWLRPPVLDTYTRLAAELNANTGELAVQGWLGEVPQTKVLTMMVG